MVHFDVGMVKLAVGTSPMPTANFAMPTEKFTIPRKTAPCPFSQGHFGKFAVGMLENQVRMVKHQVGIAKKTSGHGNAH